MKKCRGFLINLACPHVDSYLPAFYIIHMGKIILIIACILLVLTITAGFLIPKISDILGPILVFDIVVLAIGVLMIAKETRPQRF
jgi:hypothetical protein